MRVAGVRLDDGGMVWAEAGVWTLMALDRVTVAGQDGHRAGRVFVTPELLVQPPAHVDGRIVDRLPAEGGEEGGDTLPGADMPPLGSTVRTPRGAGVVVSLDPVRRTVMVRYAVGETEEAALHEVVERATAEPPS